MVYYSFLCNKQNYMVTTILNKQFVQFHLFLMIFKLKHKFRISILVYSNSDLNPKVQNFNIAVT
jgi:hypothetical protein